MPVSSKHILQQGPVIASMGRLAFAALVQKPSSGRNVSTPGPMVRDEVPPRPRDLIRDYVRHVGGDPSAYKNVVPPHLFPQWSFGLAGRTLNGLPYPLARVMNGGCRIEVRAPLPSDEPLQSCAWLESVDDNGRRAVLQQRVITSTLSAPDALVADLYAIVPLVKSKGNKRERPRVPEGAREVAFWRLRTDAGLDFGKLTGDFNPIHWSGAYARASGFRNTILQGFSTLARAYEGLRGALAASRTIRTFDCKFTRPLVLPARVGLYLDGDDAIYVGDAPGGPAYLVGHYTTETGA